MWIGRQRWHRREGVCITSCHAGLPTPLSGLSVPNLPLLLPFSLFFLSAPFLGVGIPHPAVQIHRGFSPCLHHGKAAGMLCWGSQRWISRCFPQIPLAVLVSLLHMIQFMESHTAWVRAIPGLFFLVVLGG